ncbi:hypothetical protein BC939DRAFT_525357 [Gamsiella multidivaricata]|uniref:uncharacterized protein n=1 Tax=Gamsiella multidivaricata TaxID=101098 RepID=UPI0022207140|nr:uncharacterized protein BC939DRAFT_525357 [Gamsiella multidivaricata]KAI7831337.1 hypothetical protein BC939DRAFT_525357 [Gamsiella multidivaricata]
MVINATVDVNTKIVAGALLDLKLNLHSDTHTEIKVPASGLITTKADVLIPDLSIRVDAETRSAIKVLVRADVVHLFITLKANLMTYVRLHVALLVRDLGVNLFLEQVHVQATVDAAAELDVHLNMCSHVIVKGLRATVLTKAVALVRAICSEP